MPSNNDLVIYGSGGLGRGVIELVNAINKQSECKWDLLGFIDDSNTGKINGYNILGTIDYLLNYNEVINVVLAFGNPYIKKQLFEKLMVNTNIIYPNLIHPIVEVSPFNRLGRGNIISYGVALSTNIQMSDFNLVHYNCSIGHDVRMGSFNSVFPLSALSGYNTLNNKIEIGTNTAIIPERTIADNAKIGAGTVVINDVTENKTVVGVPGKEI